MTNCFLYEFCKNKIELVLMANDNLECGDYVFSKCGYTGDESHSIYLGEINDKV